MLKNRTIVQEIDKCVERLTEEFVNKYGDGKPGIAAYLAAISKDAFILDTTHLFLCCGSLLQWYRLGARHFPWRLRPTPYKVLLSEILLQQTFAQKVVPVYLELLSEYATVRSLSKADPAHIAGVIHPLGLTYRSNVLVDLCTKIVRDFGGRSPSNRVDLLSLPGVGAYVADAVICHTCGQPVIPIDTNIQRIVCRLWGLTYPVRLQEHACQCKGYVPPFAHAPLMPGNSTTRCWIMLRQYASSVPLSALTACFSVPVVSAWGWLSSRNGLQALRRFGPGGSAARFTGQGALVLARRKERERIRSSVWLKTQCGY